MHNRMIRRACFLTPLVMGLIGLLTTEGCSSHGNLGQARYRTNCGICHHGGEGMLGEIPPLTGRIDRIARTPEGRHYLIDVLLNGLNGPLVANGGHYNFSMPSFRRLSDTEIAAILTYLSASGGQADPPTFQAGDVAAQRAQSLGPSRVADERRALDHTHPLP